jgi:hypothetical protein
METSSAILAILWLAAAIGVSLYALTSDSGTRGRRLLLALLAWAVPIVGAIIALYLLRRRRPSPASDVTSETMSIDVLAAGTPADVRARSDGDATQERQ